MKFSAAQELEIVLNEHLSLRSIESAEILPQFQLPTEEARARINLLENGETAIIAVSEKGWKVCMRAFADISRIPHEEESKREDKLFESFEAMMNYLSPEFIKHQMQTLSSKLDALNADSPVKS